MESKVFLQIVQNLELLKSTDHLKTACEEFCQLLDVPFYLMGMVSQDSLYTPKMNILTNYPEKWMDIYFKQEKHKHDPVVAYMMNKHAPTLWSRLIQLGRFNDARGQALMLEAKSYGLKNGLSIPIRATSGEFAVFSLAIDNDTEYGCTKLNQVLPFAHTFGVNLFERLITLKSPEAYNFKLTPREKQCYYGPVKVNSLGNISDY